MKIKKIWHISFASYISNAFNIALATALATKLAGGIKQTSLGPLGCFNKRFIGNIFVQTYNSQQCCSKLQIC